MEEHATGSEHEQIFLEELRGTDDHDEGWVHIREGVGWVDTMVGDIPAAGRSGHVDDMGDGPANPRGGCPVL